MFKRIIFLTLSFITATITLGVFSLDSNINIFGSIGIGLMLYLVYALFGLLTSLFYSENYTKDIGLPALIIPFGFLTLGYKRIYYSDLGYFWGRLHKDKVYVYNQGFFICKKLFEVYYDENHQVLADEIKYQLEQIFKEEIKKKNNNKDFKSWDGYVDKKSRREGQIDQII